MLAAGLLVGGAGAHCESVSSSSDLGVNSEEFDAANPLGGDAGSSIGVGGSDASGCRPGYVDTFQSTPTPYHSATAAWQGVCSPSDTAAFYAACLGSSATTSACAQFKSSPGPAACVACIETPEGASHYGPLIDYGSFVAPNVAGCIELTDPSGLPCAKEIQTASVCERAACEANCPVSGASSLAAYDACARAADEGVCQSYALAAESCQRAEEDGGVSQGCVTSDFSAYYSDIVPVFCGAQPTFSDAGMGPVDAPASIDAAAQDAGPPQDATVLIDAGDARTPTEAGADAHVPLEAGDAHVPLEAGDAHVPLEAGDATAATDGGGATISADAAEDAGDAAYDAASEDADRFPGDSADDG